MKTLFIDTSNSFVSIAMIDNGKVISKISKENFNEHSKYAISYVDEVLKSAGAKPNEIDVIMVVNGPGSFTGIRIGVTIAKIFAYLENIPVITVSSLKSLALSTDRGIILSLIDAKNDNYYLALYNDNYEEIIEPHFANKEEIEKILLKYNDIKIASNANIQFDNVEVIDTLNLERIYQYYINSEKLNAHMVLPNYLKLPQVLEK